MRRWLAYRCDRCRAAWSVDAHTVSPPVLCPGCGHIGYVVPVDVPDSPADDLRRLAEEMRRQVRPCPSGARPLVDGQQVEIWAARVEQAAAAVERMGVTTSGA